MERISHTLCIGKQIQINSLILEAVIVRKIQHKVFNSQAVHPTFIIIENDIS